MKLLHISERIRDHLVKQKAQSADIGGCKYRSDDGNMCAVGCLIEDNHYAPDLERKGVSSSDVKDAVGQSIHVKLDSNSIELLRLWQNYHDARFRDHLGVDRSYSRWIELGEEVDSPQAVHNHFVEYADVLSFDMTGVVTLRYLSQVSMYIVEHLLKQGSRSINDQNKCRYRADNGKMCAVGCLIDDKHYSDTFETLNFNDTDIQRAVARSLGIEWKEVSSYGSPMFNLLREWQVYHDSEYAEFEASALMAKHRSLLTKMQLTYNDLPN